MEVMKNIKRKKLTENFIDASNDLIISFVNYEKVIGNKIASSNCI